MAKQTLPDLAADHSTTADSSSISKVQDRLAYQMRPLEILSAVEGNRAIPALNSVT